MNLLISLPQTYKRKRDNAKQQTLLYKIPKKKNNPPKGEVDTSPTEEEEDQRMEE
jgi:hypothetical protein